MDVKSQMFRVKREIVRLRIVRKHLTFYQAKLYYLEKKSPLNQKIYQFFQFIRIKQKNIFMRKNRQNTEFEPEFQCQTPWRLGEENINALR